MTQFFGRRILVADDEPLIALMVSDMLAEMGAVAVGPVCSLKQALAAIEAGGFEAAILDVNLGDGMSYEAARNLRKRGVCFCFATGYGVATLPEDLFTTPVIGKPYRSEALARCLKAMFSEDRPSTSLRGEVRDLA